MGGTSEVSSPTSASRSRAASSNYVVVVTSGISPAPIMMTGSGAPAAVNLSAYGGAKAAAKAPGPQPPVMTRVPQPAASRHQCHLEALLQLAEQAAPRS